ncbi:MAG: hypothetical protein FWH02_04100 [Oscillospiraceae bacterium]|nr:hypothetical protein [Oscillospiraceae bacterium]
MRKIFALLLVAALVMSIAPMTFAAIADDFELGTSGQDYEYIDGVKSGDAMPWGETYELVGFNTVENEIVILFEKDPAITRGEFNASDGWVFNWQRNQGAAVVKNVSLEWEDVRGSSARLMGIKIEFVDKLVSVKEVPFKFNVEIREKGTAVNRIRATFEGDFEEARRMPNVNGDWQDVFMDKFYRIIEPTANVNRVKIITDFDDFEISTRLYRERDVYAWVSDGLDDDRYADVAAKHPEIVTVYKLEHINLANAHATVALNLPATYFIYDGEYKEIGRGNSTTLPIADVYYVATSAVDFGELGLIDVDEGPEDLDDLDDDDLDDFDIGGDTGGDTTPFNVNDNPGTGC